ncbi:MAG: hypothetical protein QXW35_01780 [Candidatus Aenigmatarchaeota archaeon]
MAVTDKVAKVFGFKTTDNGTIIAGGKDLTCNFPYLRQKLDYVMYIGAEIYRMKQRERWLTTEERKQLALLEEDLVLHLKDLYNKCGVAISVDRILKAFDEDPTLLEQISSSLSEFKLSTEQNKEEKKQ